MKRYYSHYTYIYPDTYLKNHIVELDNDNRIIRVFPYEKEVEKTQFYSGILAFVPDEKHIEERDLILQVSGHFRNAFNEEILPEINSIRIKY